MIKQGSGQPIPPPKVIAIDVDGTLLSHGELNHRLVAWCRDKQQRGYALMLWSSRGYAHAHGCAAIHGLLDLFTTICSKPGYVVDDQGWNWIRYTRVIRSFNDEVGQNAYEGSK
jgi:hydroxymethylpyrimidine pyrophosphatase-like HAD family hydrolase